MHCLSSHHTHRFCCYSSTIADAPGEFQSLCSEAPVLLAFTSQVWDHLLLADLLHAWLQVQRCARDGAPLRPGRTLDPTGQGTRVGLLPARACFGGKRRAAQQSPAVPAQPQPGLRGRRDDDERVRARSTRRVRRSHAPDRKEGRRHPWRAGVWMGESCHAGAAVWRGRAAPPNRLAAA
eukprot:6176787-Pleurochrysis_carterae.AAC.2